MLVNDELYFQTFCKLLEAVVEAGGLEAPVEHLQKNHFYLLSRKINAKSCSDYGIQPATIRDYRYIYKREKKFSVRQNRLDLMCDFIGYNGWNDFRSKHFLNPQSNQHSKDQVTLLILPDKRFGAVQQFEGQIGELIYNRYEELREELGIDNLKIIYQDSLKSLPTGIKEIREFGRANRADMVIWTEYLHGNTPMMRVPSLLVDPGKQVSKYKKQSYQDAAALTNLHSGAFLEKTDIMLFQLLGTLAYEKGETERAIEFCEKVLQLDPKHEETLTFLSQLIAPQETTIHSTIFTDDTTIVEEDHFVQEKSISETLSTNQNALVATLKEDLLPISHQTASLDNHLLVLEGDNRVLKVKDLEPLIRNTLIHEDETVIFLTRKTDLELMSMNDLTVFKLEASQKEIPIKEALVRLNQWHQNTKGSEKDKDQPPLPFYSPTPSKYTNKEALENDPIRIIIFPNSSNQMHVP